VGIYTRLKSAKIFGRKDSVCMEPDASFYIQNVKKGQASRTAANIRREISTVILISLQNPDFWHCYDRTN